MGRSAAHSGVASFFTASPTKHWPRWVLGVLAVAAYQYGLHIYVLSTFVPGERSDGLSVLSVSLGTPVAIAWAVLTARYAGRVFEDRVLPLRVLVGSAVYTAAVVLAFAVYVSHHLGWDKMRYWLDMVAFFTAYSTVLLPFTLALYVGGAWKIPVLAALGVPTVGPMLLLIRWAASSRAATPPRTA